MQCSACRSSEFRGQPSFIEEYNLARRQERKSRRVHELEGALSDISKYPFHIGWLLFIIGALLVMIGVMLSGTAAKATIIIGSMLIGLSSFLSRIELIKGSFERKLKILQRR